MYAKGGQKIAMQKEFFGYDLPSVILRKRYAKFIDINKL